MVYKYLLGNSNSIEVENIRFTGHPYAVAAFYNPSNRALFEKGVVFSTGYAEGIKGPNDSPQSSGVTMSPGDRNLTIIANNPTLDAVVLEFDFKATTDSLSFEYFFGSEEYPEYVNQGVNDVFAFLLSKQEDRKYSNLAYLPNNKGPITVDNINDRRNTEYYIPNPRFDSRPTLEWEGNEDEGEMALTYQFDGFTTVLTAAAKIEPGVWYHMKIAIGDAGDEVYDSGVFIKTGSFRSYESVEMQKAKALQNELFKGFNSADVKTLTNGNLMLITHIEFDIDESKIRENSIADLEKVFEILQSKPDWKLKISGHTDDQGKNEYNQKLSEKRAASVMAYFAQKGIEPIRMRAYGYGESQPILPGTSEVARQQNRRVEFEFIKKND